MSVHHLRRLLWAASRSAHPCSACHDAASEGTDSSKTCFHHQMISVAAAITIPVTNAVKKENSSRSLRTTLMAASPCGPWSIPRAQRTPLLWRKGDLVELWDESSQRVAFADPSNRVSPFDGEPPSCEGDRKSQLITICGSSRHDGRLSACGHLQMERAPEFPARWSNDQCEQFNDAYSDHQHSKCHGVVIEPMRPLYIHRRPVPRFELLDECSEMRGHRRRQSVILGPEAVPN
jgi:hypothetical protein